MQQKMMSALSLAVEQSKEAQERANRLAEELETVKARNRELEQQCFANMMD